MKKNFFYMALGLVGIMGALSIGVVDAAWTITNGYTETSFNLTGDDEIKNINFKYKTITLSDGKTSYILMDRNLGARVPWNPTNNSFSENNSSFYNTENDYYGYYYQWGNNYGFSAKTTAGVNGPVTVNSDQMPSKFSSSTWIKTNPWDNGSSSNNYNYDLWGDITDGYSARRGPCPEGWHVPTTQEWTDIETAFCLEEGLSNCSYNFRSKLSTFLEKFKIPSNGLRRSDLKFFSQGSDAELWTSTSSHDKSSNVYYQVFNSTAYGADIKIRTAGMAVRCLQNLPTRTVTFKANGETFKSVDVKKGGTVSQPSLPPTTDNGTFQAWYKSVGATTSFSFSTAITADTELFAKFTCSPGYQLKSDWSGCEEISYTVTYNKTENGGEGENEQATVGYNGQADLTKTATKEGYDFLGWNTDKNAHAGLTTLTVTQDTPLYAIFSKTLTGTYTATHASIAGGLTSDTCTMYNKETSCSITLPSVTCDAGYHTPVWSPSNLNGITTNTPAEVSCTLCEAGYYCESGIKTQCPAGYTSVAGASTQNQCYKVITATFQKNGASNVSSSSVSCNLYNGSSSCPIVAPTIAPASGFDVVGFNTDANATDGTTPTSISDDITYYAITKSSSPVQITFDANNNEGSYSPVSCYRYNGSDSCSVTSPGITPANGFTVIGWSTAVGTHTNQWTGGVSRTVSESTTYYAQSEKAGYPVTASYVVGTGVTTYSNTTNTCNVEKVYNGADYVACNITLPTLTLRPGYNTGVWSTGAVTENQGAVISLLADDTYTASASPDTDTQYFVKYYQEELDGTYTEHEIYTGEGTTDTQAIATGDDKTYPGFVFSGTHADNVTSGNINGEGNRVLSLYYDRVEYTLTFDSNSGTVVDPITAKYQSGIILPETTRTGYQFTGWKDENDTIFSSGDVYTLLGNTTLTGQWKAETYTVTYDVNGGSELTPNTGLVTYDSAYGTLPTPSRNGYSFNGWFTASTNGTKIEASTIVSATGDHTLYAQWTQNKSSGGSTGGGGGGSGKSTANSTTNSTTQHNSAAESTTTGDTKATTLETKDSDDKLITTPSNDSLQNGKETETQNYSNEMQEAYEFAYENKITTMDSIEKANMGGPLSRLAMAKMLSYYAINVLGQKPDTTRKIKFNDVSEELDSQYDEGVTLAYQLGIMGINMPNNNFRPNDEVSRKEFATALSRMLFKTADGKEKYYTTHLEKLMEEKIITNTDPELQELRGYTMIMLMRSVK